MTQSVQPVARATATRHQRTDDQRLPDATHDQLAAVIVTIAGLLGLLTASVSQTMVTASGEQLASIGGRR